jgi:hypothetical protein
MIKDAIKHNKDNISVQAMPVLAEREEMVTSIEGIMMAEAISMKAEIMIAHPRTWMVNLMAMGQEIFQGNLIAKNLFYAITANNTQDFIHDFGLCAYPWFKA